jgi:hypothetical protein
LGSALQVEDLREPARDFLNQPARRLLLHVVGGNSCRLWALELLEERLDDDGVELVAGLVSRAVSGQVSRRALRERLAQVGDQVAGVLDTAAEADQISRNGRR